MSTSVECVDSTFVYTQSVVIETDLAQVDRCLTDPDLMRRWLNPLLRCEAIGSWSDQVGGRFRFTVGIPLWQPSLDCVIRSRGIEPDTRWIEWGFEGFFVGSDLWRMVPFQTQDSSNQNKANHQPKPAIELVNRFRFGIPNPVVNWGFQMAAAGLTQRDMQAQLQRIKQVAEGLNPSDPSQHQL